jgi:hypothetical protein
MKAGMKALVDEVMKSVKQLPGFGVVVVALTLVYSLLRQEQAEMSALETLGVGIISYILYRLGATFDRLFDWIFEPGSRAERLSTARRKQHNEKYGEMARAKTLLDRLSDSRDEACKSLFSPVNGTVVDFSTAKAAHFVGERSTHGLYKSAKAVAKHTKKWEESIGPYEEYSKAARTIAVLVVLLLLVRFSASARADVISKSLLAGNALTPLGQLIVGIGTGAILLALYVTLRLRHMVTLYSHVADSVVHVQTAKGPAAAIFDVLFKPPQSRSA